MQICSVGRLLLLLGCIDIGLALINYVVCWQPLAIRRFTCRRLQRCNQQETTRLYASARSNAKATAKRKINSNKNKKESASLSSTVMKVQDLNGGDTKLNNNAKNGGGFGMRKFSSASRKRQSVFDVSASLARSEKLYDELCANAAKSNLIRNNYNDMQNDEEYNKSLLLLPTTTARRELIHTEYIIATRHCTTMSSFKVQQHQSQKAPKSVADWVPIAQLCISRYHDDTNDHVHVPAAISHYCREINHAAKVVAPSIFGPLSRSNMQYSAEPIQSFFKYVYDEVMAANHGEENAVNGNNNNDASYTSGSKMNKKAQARQILGVPDNCNDLKIIKKAYRTLSMELHPDRLTRKFGENRTSNNMDQQRLLKDASINFISIRDAYTILSSGVRSSNYSSSSSLSCSGTMPVITSWYESLGGKERTDFMGPIKLIQSFSNDENGRHNMLQQQQQQRSLNDGGFQSAMAGLDPDIIMSFIARNQDAASASASALAREHVEQPSS